MIIYMEVFIMKTIILGLLAQIISMGSNPQGYFISGSDLQSLNQDAMKKQRGTARPQKTTHEQPTRSGDPSNPTP